MSALRASEWEIDRERERERQREREGVVYRWHETQGVLGDLDGLAQRQSERQQINVVGAQIEFLDEIGVLGHQLRHGRQLRGAEVDVRLEAGREGREDRLCGTRVAVAQGE